MGRQSHIIHSFTIVTTVDDMPIRRKVFAPTTSKHESVSVHFPTGARVSANTFPPNRLLSTEIGVPFALRKNTTLGEGYNGPSLCAVGRANPSAKINNRPEILQWVGASAIVAVPKNGCENVSREFIAKSS